MFQKLNNSKELIKFLKAKITENINNPKNENEFFTREQSELNEIALEVKNQIEAKEQERLRKEVQEEMNRNYNEL